SCRAGAAARARGCSARSRCGHGSSCPSRRASRACGRRPAPDREGDGRALDAGWTRARKAARGGGDRPHPLAARLRPARRRRRALVLDEQRVRAPALESLRELGLTRREAQVLRLVCCGKGNDQIARELSISSRTVGKHLERAYSKLGVGSRAAAIAIALGMT